MKDSWPFGVALRREAASRLMPRWLKTVVVSDEEKAPGEASGGDREGERERIVADVSKPLRDNGPAGGSHRQPGRGAAAFGLFGGQRVGGLGGERGGAVAGPAAEGSDDGFGGDNRGRERGIGQVDDGVPGLVEEGAGCDGLAAPASPVTTPSANDRSRTR